MAVQAILAGVQHLAARSFSRVDGWDTPYISIKIGKVLFNIEDRDALNSLSHAVRHAPRRPRLRRTPATRRLTSSPGCGVAGDPAPATRLPVGTAADPQALRDRLRTPAGPRLAGGRARHPAWRPGPRALLRRALCLLASRPGLARAHLTGKAQNIFTAKSVR